MIDMDYMDFDVFPAGTEIVETEQNEMIALILDQNEILTNIRDDLHIVMFFVLFSFCWSGIRAWRKNFAKGV